MSRVLGCSVFSLYVLLGYQPFPQRKSDVGFQGFLDRRLSLSVRLSFFPLRTVHVPFLVEYTALFVRGRLCFSSRQGSLAEL